MSEQLPPKGLLAELALAATDAEKSVVKPPVPTPSDLPVDPNYREPASLNKFTDIAIALSKLPSEELVTCNLERGQLINILLHRLGELEAALIPIAQQGMVMANARLCLRAEGRGEEPAGGHWINQVSSTHLAPSESMFFNAIDTVGRARVHEHMIAIFNRVQESQRLIAERNEHIAAGGRVQ